MKQFHIIPDRMNPEESRELAEKWNAVFEYNDFFLPAVLEDAKEVEQRVALYKKLVRNRSKDTLHGAFFDLCVSSTDPEIAQISVKRMRQSMEIAEKLGVRAVIFHTNTIAGFSIPGYEERFIEQNEKVMRTLLTEYKGIDIYMENMFDLRPDILSHLAERMQDTNFGVCYDVAHGNLGGSCNMEEWFKSLSPYVRHLHINDNDGISDAHQAVGWGQTNWTEFGRLMKKYSPDSSILIEVNGKEKIEKSFEYMKENKIYPFEA